MKTNLIILVGEQGCGKTTLANHMTKIDKYDKYITCTTRPPREGEINGVDYVFLTKEGFEKRRSLCEFIEYKKYRGWYYGTPNPFCATPFHFNDTDQVLILTPKGVDDFTFWLKDNNYTNRFNVYIFYLDVNFKARYNKSMETRDDKHEVKRRAFHDYLDFLYFKHKAKNNGLINGYNINVLSNPDYIFDQSVLTRQIEDAILSTNRNI